MLHVGLTGGIASGKSTVSNMFQEKGAFLIDFDELAHIVEEPGKQAWVAIINAFGKEILRENGSIDRAKLGQVVFYDSAKRSRLNRIVHPAVFEEWQCRIEAIKVEKNNAVIISDVPLLFEVGLNSMFDVSILVYVPPDVQIKRLMARNGYTEEESKARLLSQMSIEEKKKLADIIIENVGSLSETEKRIHQVWKDLLRKERNIRQHTGG
jgi:dephospho-CoA kinase